ncbi:1,5-anhydro-D-fructose reductase-like [Diabrotica virgifera virgifera]|uniref:NADP-dependent oxidoreductase domain-containing protein n=1 Tax=Diabrotica virgifera virgifera TaxID=50390 RepID=A0ABM5K072_DIAVI|nr:1,5-anhydro-D-fructose reductase-like [Diabrotica virgifera virgifera]
MANTMYKIMHNGRRIPCIGLGTWMATKKEELTTALNTAFDCGYRLFDTAYIYQNESIIGNAIKHWLSSGKVKREDLFITTKLPISGLCTDRVELFLKKSLNNLQLDYVDLYLIHFPVGTNMGKAGTPLHKLKLEMSDHKEVWKEMERQVKENRTKAIGMCNFTQKQMENIIKASEIQPACLQIESHVYLQQNSLVDYCQQNNITVIGFSPLGNPGYNNFLKTIGQNARDLPNGLQNEVIKLIAKKHKKTPGQIMIRYLIERNIIPIPKSVSPQRIKENIEIFDFALDNDDMKKIKGLDKDESGRILKFDFFSEEVRDSPEFPFPKCQEVSAN